METLNFSLSERKNDKIQYMALENTEGDDARKQMQMNQWLDYSRSQEKGVLVENRYDSIVDLIVNAETEEDRRYWVFFALERIVNYNDDWSARVDREDLAKRVAKTDPARLSLLGKTGSQSSEQIKEQESLNKALTIIQDVDLVFDQWFGFYKKMAPTGKIFQLAFGQEPEYMPPEKFRRIYGELPGFKDGDPEWKTMSDQIDIAIRAYLYLALQSDPRWKDDLEWYKSEPGFKKLFDNGSTELDWIRRLKLKTLPNEKNELASLRGKNLDELSSEELATLDRTPALNKFADPGSGATVKAISEAVAELVSGEKYKNDPAMKMQSNIAINFADKTMRFFGLAAMYGTRGTSFNGDGVATKVAAEDYPWSDAWTDLTRPQDNITYCKQNSYYPGPMAWVKFAPEHIIVDFLKMMPVSDAEYPESKEKMRSAFELFVEGKTIGEIMADEAHIGDWSYRAFLIRGLFSLREDSGAYLALNGDLVRGKNKDNIFDEKFLEDVEKSIHIVCRNWLITRGRYKKWFEDHRPEIQEKASDPKFAERIRKDYLEKGMKNVGYDIVYMEASDKVLARYVAKEKNKWKAIVWLNSMPYIDEVQRKVAVRAAKRVGYLDPTVLDLTLSINFSDAPTKTIEQMRQFIIKAEDSVN